MSVGLVVSRLVVSIAALNLASVTTTSGSTFAGSKPLTHYCPFRAKPQG